MRKIKLLQKSLLFILISISTTYTQAQPDKTTKIPLDIENFSGINIIGDFSVFISEGENLSVEVEGDKKAAEALNTEINNGIWDIKFKESGFANKKLSIFIVMPSFESLRISGDGNITLEEFKNLKDIDFSIAGKGEIMSTASVAAENVRIEITGKGKVNLNLNASLAETVINGDGTVEMKGAVNKIKVNIAGFGTFKSYETESDDAEINITGKGVCEMNTKKTVELNVTGQASINYTGEPEIKKNITGKVKFNNKK